MRNFSAGISAIGKEISRRLPSIPDLSGATVASRYDLARIKLEVLADIRLGKLRNCAAARKDLSRASEFFANRIELSRARLVPHALRK